MDVVNPDRPLRIDGGGASFDDSPQIANVKPHKAYKIHVATKSDKIKRTPGIVRRVVTEVARLYYATGERPGFSLKGIRGKGGWEEFTVALGPLKDSPLALAMYNVDVFMKAFTAGARYFPQSGSSLDETRRLARMNKRLEGDRQTEGTKLYDWVNDWGGCYDFQDDIKLKNLYQEYKGSKTQGGNYCFSPYVRSCSVSEDGARFFFEPDIHVNHHGYNTRDGTPVNFSFNETEKEYVQIVKDAIDSNSELAYDLDIIHVACCAYALVQSLPRDRVCDVRDIDPVPPDEDMKLLSPLQYGIAYHCVGCQREHLDGGVEPTWAEINPTVVDSPPPMKMSFAFDLPTMGAPDLNLDVEWSRVLVENLDETLVLDVAMHDRPYLSAEEIVGEKAPAAALHNPKKSWLVGTDGQPFASYLELVKYYKSGTEARRAAYKEEPGAFTSGWKVNNDFDAKKALLKLARKKGDCVTEAIVRTRLDVDGVQDGLARSDVEQRLLRAAALATAAAAPVHLSKLTLTGHTESVKCVAISPDRRRVVSGGGDLKVWNAETGKCVSTIHMSNWVCCVAISPDGRRIVSGNSKGYICVWDLETGERVAMLAGHYYEKKKGNRGRLRKYENEVTSVAISPDGRRFVSGGKDNWWKGKIKVWDMETGRRLATLKGHSGWVLCVAVFPDGRRVVSGSCDNDKTLKVWDVATGKCVATLEGHSYGVMSVAISPDGRRVVSGSCDKTLKVWDVATGKCVATLEGHSGWVRCSVHCTFVTIWLRRRSGASPSPRTGGASCLARSTRRSWCGTWRPANAWRC